MGSAEEVIHYNLLLDNLFLSSVHTFPRTHPRSQQISMVEVYQNCWVDQPKEDHFFGSNILWISRKEFIQYRKSHMDHKVQHGLEPKIAHNTPYK